jgi:hypothetical protein
VLSFIIAFDASSPYLSPFERVFGNSYTLFYRKPLSVVEL